MNRLVRISDAAAALGVSITELRRWEKSGKLRFSLMGIKWIS